MKFYQLKMYLSGMPNFEKYFLIITIFSINRDASGNNSWYETIAVVEHTGSLSSTGVSYGHYKCEVKDKESKLWFQTNDDCYPHQIDPEDVSKLGYAYLLSRKTD